MAHFWYYGARSSTLKVLLTANYVHQLKLLISLMLRTNYVIRVTRIKDKGDIDKFKYL